MAKIESLTDDQRAKFPEYVKRWTEIGLSTEPADRPRAEAAIRLMYERGGLKPPRRIVWCGSPLSMALTRYILTQAPKMKESVGASVRDSVGASVRASVRDSVWDSVGASVGDSVRDSVRASVRASVWDSVRDSVGASVYGQHYANWLAFYRYFREVCGLKAETEKLNGLWELAESAGWALPHKNICWVSERHNILARDDRGLLHSVVGPACAFPDGWAIYAVHGVRVPEFVIERSQEITVEKIDAETNAEVRRVMIDQYKSGEEVHGGAAFTRDAGGEVLDHDERFGTLRRRDVSNDEPIIVLEVINSTPEPDGSWKHYHLRVPPTVKTAHEASAWTFDMKVSEYAPLIET